MLLSFLLVFVFFIIFSSIFKLKANFHLSFLRFSSNIYVLFYLRFNSINENYFYFFNNSLRERMF